jgi:hypothetical protein
MDVALKDEITAPKSETKSSFSSVSDFDAHRARRRDGGADFGGQIRRRVVADLSAKAPREY